MSDEKNEQDDFEVSLGIAPDPDEVTPSNAGDDAIMGTVADQPPDMPDNPPLDEGLDPDPSTPVPIDPDPEPEE